jgi:hypothetical protein
MADSPTWPPPPAGLNDGDKLLYQAKLDFEREVAKAALDGETAAEQAQQASDAARIAAREAASYSSIASFHGGLIEVAKAAIDRARAGADAVQKAAGAIAGTYTAVLAVAFSVTENPLPSRAMVPTILLGWAIVWSTVYLAYLSNSEGVEEPEPTTSLEEGAMRRSIAFILWTRSGAMNRGFALRTAVIALAFGLALLPAPFVGYGGANTGAVAEQPGFPTPPKGDREVEKVLYEAEVKETSELRKKDNQADDGDDTIWWVACGIALFLSLALPPLITRFEPEPS